MNRATDRLYSGYLAEVRKEKEKTIAEENEIKEKRMEGNRATDRLYSAMHLAEAKRRRKEKMKSVTNAFHRLYYDPRTSLNLPRPWRNVSWLGQPVFKMPSDLLNLQEMIYVIQPDFIIETGTAKGGSAFFYATILDFIGKGKVITIGNEDEKMPSHKIFKKRVKCLLGDSISEEIQEKVEAIIGDNRNVIVTLDSNHKAEHVLKELEIYSKYVQIGNYIVVEDSNINGHPVDEKFGPGPYEAIQEFLENNTDFEIDDLWVNKHLITFFVDGYLKRVK